MHLSMCSLRLPVTCATANHKCAWLSRGQRESGQKHVPLWDLGDNGLFTVRRKSLHFSFCVFSWSLSNVTAWMMIRAVNVLPSPHYRPLATMLRDAFRILWFTVNHLLQSIAAVSPIWQERQAPITEKNTHTHLSSNVYIHLSVHIGRFKGHVRIICNPADFRPGDSAQGNTAQVNCWHISFCL